MQKNRLRKCHLIVVFFSVCLIDAVAKETAQLEFVSTNVSLSIFQSGLEDRRLSDRFIERFAQEIPLREYSVVDHLGPYSTWNWVRRTQSQGYKVHDTWNNAGAGAFADVIADSLRETAVAVFPVDHWGEVIGESIKGIVGNTAEEKIDTLDADYSAAAAEWVSRSDYKKLEWGLRPWRTAPYVYGRVNFGHFRELPALSLEFRTGYDIFEAERLELRAVSPISDTARVSVGAVMAPSRWGDRSLSASFRIEKALSKRPDTPFVFAGMRSNALVASSSSGTETVIRCGLNIPW